MNKNHGNCKSSVDSRDQKGVFWAQKLFFIFILTDLQYEAGFFNFSPALIELEFYLYMFFKVLKYASEYLDLHKDDQQYIPVDDFDNDAEGKLKEFLKILDYSFDISLL